MVWGEIICSHLRMTQNGKFYPTLAGVHPFTMTVKWPNKGDNIWAYKAMGLCTGCKYEIFKYLPQGYFTQSDKLYSLSKDIKYIGF